MIRELTGHKVNPANDQLLVRVHDEPGAGGACHAYSIQGFDARRNVSRNAHGLPLSDINNVSVGILFQNGPIAEVGVNGVTHEALLAILIDRLEGFQAGEYACEENALALENLRDAQRQLQARTRKRIERGVEGTHEK